MDIRVLSTFCMYHNYFYMTEVHFGALTTELTF